MSRNRTRLEHAKTWSKRLLVLIAGGTAVGGLLWVGQVARDWVCRTPYFQLKSIEYRGAQYFDVEAFNVVLLRTFEKNLLRLDLERIRSVLESEAWIKRAVVRRRFPDRLVIYLTERRPAAVAAVDGQLYVVASDGVLLDVFHSGYGDIQGPIVRGLRNPARDRAGTENAVRMETYLRLVEEFRASDPSLLQRISEVDVTEPERVGILLVDDPTPIYLGDRDFLARYRRFEANRTVYLELRERYGQVEYVDAGYRDRIVFHTPQTLAEQKNSPRPGPELTN
ncbi:MAG TPA: FtsQ-type POTRA domain-containing protein [Acidobacteriota bacterium]|nr:FtsQ-type POTRA domain-containing protein [Acidobacteriota bacterium]